MRQIAGMLFAALCGLLVALAIAACGCAMHVEHTGKQQYDVYHHHDKQEIDVNIWRRGRKREP